MADFKVGDRVRATLGENVLVGFVDGNGQVEGMVAVRIDGDGVRRWLDLEVWHIEKVSPPLPTKVGAIVRRADGELFVNDAEGSRRWVSLDGAANSHRDEVVSRGGFEVIFEGVDQ